MELGNLLFGHSRGTFIVDRKLERYFVEQLESLGFDAYGYTKEGKYGFQNEIFEVRPYWWGDDDALEATLPNFRYIPMNIEIRWYKYPLRDSYSNKPITYELLTEIFRECKKNIKKGEK